MELTHFRSATNLRSRPIGPRSPKVLPTPGDLSLDLNNRLEEATPAYYPSSSKTRPTSPESAPRPLSQSSDAQRPESRERRLRQMAEKSIQADLVIDTLEVPVLPPARSSSPIVRKIPKAPTLTIPPAVTFDSEPVPWRGMTLEAAQWTFSSQELQEIVSSAIRRSAQEGFIRLVSTKIFEEELPPELERLETLKATTQSQYRFNMHRRTMLLQSLNALSITDGGDAEALFNLTTQLAQVTTTCDRLMETLLRITDQRAQILRLQDMHVASALAMALRKLNSSYAKRVTELRESRTRIEEMKAELEEAWDVAQVMAQEMDDLDTFHTGFSDDEEEADPRQDDGMNAVEMVGVTGIAVASKAMLTSVEESVVDPAVAPGDYSIRVSAARKRSSRASKASLRRPKGANGDRVSIGSISRRKSQSKMARGASADGDKVPDVPILHVEKAPPHDNSFLELSETRPASPANGVVVSEAVPPLPMSGIAPKPAAELRGTVVHLPEIPHISHPIAALEPPGSAELSVPHPPRLSQLIPSPGFENTFLPLSKDDLLMRPERNQTTRRVRSLQIPRRSRHFDDSTTQSTDPMSVQQTGWPALNVPKAKRFTVPLTNEMAESMAVDQPDTSSVRESVNLRSEEPGT